MKKTVLFILSFLFLTSILSAQFWTLDFESASGYTTSITEFTDTYNDYWLRTDGSDNNGIYNSPIGTYYFAGMDIDGEGATLPVFIDINDIDISGQTNIIFTIYLAEDDDGTDQDWDPEDYLHIGYDIDNTGSFTPLLWVESEISTGYNGAPKLDTDFDGVGDGIEITDTFVQFNVSIPGTGSLLDLQLEYFLNSGDEDIAIDNLQLFAAGGNSLPIIAGVAHTPSSDITSSTTVSVSADVTDSDGTISLVELKWGLTFGSLGTTITMSNGGSGDTYTTVTDIPAQSDGVTVYYEIYAEDDVPESSTSVEYNYTVTDPATTTIPYSKTFRDELDPCYTFSVLGATKEWFWNSGGYAACNGYNSGDTEEDWLILPGINLDNYTDENLVFESWYNYGTDDANNYLKLYYSTDYTGLGDPSSIRANWTELSFTHPSINLTWSASGNVDLSGIGGTMVYIAFKYHYEAGSYRSWGIDNISITDDGPVPTILSSFYANYIGGIPTIYWITESEVNNEYWNVYRGTNDTFTEALHLNANDPVAGNGTTNNISEYVYVDMNPVVQNTTYWYWIEDVPLDGETEVHEPITLFIPYEDIEDVPVIYGLHQNYPNPFNPSTTISFTLEEESDVELIIYNVKGEKIKEYMITDDQTFVIWDGTNEYNQPVSSGVYFYKLITDTKEYQKKMLLVK